MSGFLSEIEKSSMYIISSNNRCYDLLEIRKKDVMFEVSNQFEKLY
jgi:hypothetical protein